MVEAVFVLIFVLKKKSETEIKSLKIQIQITKVHETSSDFL